LQKLPLSVAIISQNEERIIAQMLESVSKIASEIVIVDSGSTDRTLEIAKGFGANIFEEDWKGFIEQKNSAMQKCTNDWILFLDCDEVCNQELLESISDLIQDQKIGSYSINRKTHYLGKLLDYAWQPDVNLRLVHKSTNPIWRGVDIHDKLFSDTESILLRRYIIKYAYND
jgi:glycosyltransferase involved in cell wall biosynthesis